MIDTVLSELSYAHWLILGIVLLLVEILTTSGFLLGTAISALLIGAAMWFDPSLHWQMQLFFFTVLAVGLSVLYWRKFKSFNDATDRPLLNNKLAQMIGKQTKLAEYFDGFGKLQFGDTFWQAKSEHAIDAGTLIEVIDVVDGVLIIQEKD